MRVRTLARISEWGGLFRGVERITRRVVRYGVVAPPTNMVHIRVHRTLPPSASKRAIILIVSSIFRTLFSVSSSAMKNRHRRSLSARSAPSRRSRGKTALFPNGSASERTIPSSTTPSVVTGAEPSSDSREDVILWNRSVSFWPTAIKFCFGIRHVMMSALGAAIHL
jgi:hypothetical protein